MILHILLEFNYWIEEVQHLPQIHTQRQSQFCLDSLLAGDRAVALATELQSNRNFELSNEMLQNLQGKRFCSLELVLVVVA